MADDPLAENDDPNVQTAHLEFNAGKVQIKTHVRMTPRGLLAVGALVSGILLSTAALVWVSTSVPRRHPIAGRLPFRR